MISSKRFSKCPSGSQVALRTVMPPLASGDGIMAAEGKFQAFGRSQSHVLKELDAIRESQKQIFLQHMQLELKHRFEQWLVCPDQGS